MWEDEWAPLKDSVIAGLLSYTERRIVDEAVRGYETPLLNALGISPEGALRKLPSRECQKRKTCTFYQSKRCTPLSSEMPWCFFPEGIDIEENLEPLVMEVIAAWRDRQYVVIVSEYV